MTNSDIFTMPSVRQSGMPEGQKPVAVNTELRAVKMLITKGVCYTTHTGLCGIGAS